MKDLIMQMFESCNCKAGNIVPMRTIRQNILRNLNPKDQERAIDEINSLIDSGYIIYESGSNGLESLRLTEVGFKELYKNSKTVTEIERIILSKFEEIHSKPGDILLFRTLNHTVFSKFNPIEKDLIEDAINHLINIGYITYEGEKSGLECIRLTDLGYSILYN